MPLISGVSDVYSELPGRTTIHISNVEVRERTGLPAVSETISQRRLSMLGHMSRMPPSADAYKVTKPSTKTFLQTGGDDLVDLDSPNWLPYREICGNVILAWTTFANLCRSCTYYRGGWFVALYAPLWCMLLMMMICGPCGWTISLQCLKKLIGSALTRRYSG